MFILKSLQCTEVKVKAIIDMIIEALDLDLGVLNVLRHSKLHLHHVSQVL